MLFLSCNCQALLHASVAIVAKTAERYLYFDEEVSKEELHNQVLC